MKYKDTLTQRLIRFMETSRPKCSYEGMNWIYFFYNPITKLTKIGHTSDHVHNRKRALERQSGCKLYCILALNMQQTVDPIASNLERWLHKEFASVRQPHGEWFNLKWITFGRIYAALFNFGDDIDDEIGDLRRSYKLNLPLC